MMMMHQTLADDSAFQSEASASELSDTGGDEEKHGYKPRRRSVMAGKVITRRRFPTINGNNNNNNQSIADEKETDMDGGGSTHGQGPTPTGPLPLQQPLRVPRQLPAKSSVACRFAISPIHHPFHDICHPLSDRTLSLNPRFVSHNKQHLLHLPRSSLVLLRYGTKTWTRDGQKWIFCSEDPCKPKRTFCIP